MSEESQGGQGARNVLDLSDDELLDLVLGPRTVSAVPAAPCPECRAPLSEMRYEPRAGQPALCLCGAKLVFTDELGLRIMTDEDREHIATQDPQLLIDVDEMAANFRWLAGLEPGKERP
jgi:hypothetical protein